MSDHDVETKPSRFLRAFLSKSMESFRPKTIARLARRSFRGRPDTARSPPVDSLKNLRITDSIELCRQVPNHGMPQEKQGRDDSAGTATRTKSRRQRSALSEEPARTTRTNERTTSTTRLVATRLARQRSLRNPVRPRPPSDGDRHNGPRATDDLKLEYGAFACDFDVADGGMLAKATRTLQEHVRDVAEKTKSSCCVGGCGGRKAALAAEKEKMPAAAANDGIPVRYVYDNVTGTTYVRGRLLGKGGFAKCYEMIDQKSQKIYAGKVIAKNRLSKPHQKEKIIREIELHRNLSHVNVVAFHSFFEDDDYVYIILEVCTRKSLVHVLKNRKTLTEPEVRYYLRQLVEGCRYIHGQRIIHRDLKLGNMLLNDDMRVKIADFGLATRVEFDGERKMTVCGTPNYIAPEVLQKKGHSYEADLWAIGCTMYAMLVGRPPFETSTLKETYVRITSNKYYLPSHISTPARNLIQRLLSPEPSQRPSLEKILADEFFSAGYTPKTLASSCCEWAPKYSVARILPRPKSYAAPVSPAEAIDKISNLVQTKGSRKAASQILTKTSHHSKETEFPSSKDLSSLSYTKRPASTEPRASQFGSSVRLYQMLSTCIDAMPADANPSPVPNPRPLWVTKWVDYSNKYGFGFQLADRSVGVLFNDSTRMLLAPDGRTVQYNDLSNRVYTFRTESAPSDYQKKATLLLYFAQYMDEHLIQGGDATRDYGSWTPTGIFMKKWFRTDRAIVMYLNNGTLQVNFFGDHTKVILSPDSHDYLVTYINQQRVATTYHLLQVRHFGCHPEIVERLRYGKRVLEKIINVSGESV